MNTNEETTQKTERDVSNKSMLPATAVNRTGELQLCSSELKEAMSALVNSAVSYVERSNNLLHSQFEKIEKEYLNDEEPTSKVSEHHIDIIKTLGPEIREGLKSGAQLIALQMKMERGESL